MHPEGLPTGVGHDLSVYGSVRRLVEGLNDPDSATLARAALALRLAAHLDMPEEGKGTAAVARELRMLLTELAAGDQDEAASRLEQVLGRMASPD